MNITAVLLTILFFMVLANIWPILKFVLKTIWFLFGIICVMIWVPVVYGVIESLL